MPKPKLYVGCSLTQAPEDFKAAVKALKAALREQNYEIFEFVGLEAGTAREVYEWDLGHCVGECDMFLAVCDYPSLGLGWELSHAVRLGKPVLAVAHQDSKVTRMVLGAAEVEPNLAFERYDDLAAGVPDLLEAWRHATK